MKKKMFFILVFLLFAMSVFANNNPSYAPQGAQNPIIMGYSSDKDGEVDLYWYNMQSSNDTSTGTSYVSYKVYRYTGINISNVDTLTVINTWNLIENNIPQSIVNGLPTQTYTYYSDTSAKTDGYYTYAVIAYDSFDSTYSNLSDTFSIYADSTGPILQSAYLTTKNNLSYVTKTNIELKFYVYEPGSLSNNNIILNYGFLSDTSNLSSINGFDTSYFSVTSISSGTYLISANLPVNNAGLDTMVIYWISGTDNALGLSNEPVDYTDDGNALTSNLSGNNLLDSTSANILFIDDIPPVLSYYNIPDSINQIVPAQDTTVSFYVTDNMRIETGCFNLNYKVITNTGVIINAQSQFSYTGSNYQSGTFTVTLPLSNYPDKSQVTIWLSGADTAGNNISSSLTPSFISVTNGITYIIDAQSPQINTFNTYNKTLNTDYYFSTNIISDSLLIFKTTIYDTSSIDTIYLKLYSNTTNTDTTNYITGGKDKVFFTLTDSGTYSTTWTSETITLNKNGIVYPYLTAKDIYGYTTNYMDSNLIYIISELPKITSIQHINNDTPNTKISAGDTLIFTFNNKIDSSTMPSIQQKILNSSANQVLGTVTSFLWNSSDSILNITLPANFTFNANDTVFLDSTVLDYSSNIGDTTTTVAIPDRAGPILTSLNYKNNDTWTVNSTIINAGDSIYFHFSENCDTTKIPQGTLNNLTDTILISNSKNFGTNHYTTWLSDSELVVRLGASTTITDADSFTLTTKITDLYSNNAEINYITILDTAGPVLYNSVIDINYDSSGKTAVLYFSEPIDSTTILTTNFSSKSAIDTISYIGTDTAYIKFVNPIIGGSDTIALKNNIKDISSTKNSASILNPVYIIDTDSPYLKYVNHLNNDTAIGNTGFSAGDTLIFTFSEPIDLNKINKNVFIDSFPLSGSSDTYGDFSILFSNDSKIIYVRLGSGVIINSGDTVNLTSLVTDLSGNPDITAETVTVNDSAFPVITGFSYMNNDTSLNSIISIGDTLVIYLSEPIDTSISSGNINNYIYTKGISNNQFGNSPIKRFSATGETIYIQITSGFNLSYGDTFSLSTNVSDINGNKVKTVYTKSFSDSIAPYLINAIYSNTDTSYTTFHQNDTITLTFSEQIDTTLINLNNFIFTNSGNNLGTTSSFIQTDTNIIKIIMGSAPTINSGDTLLANSAIKDLNNNLYSQPFNVNVYDSVAANVVSVSYYDNDNNSRFSSGDTFEFYFSEPIDSGNLKGTTFANLNDTLIISNGHNFGTTNSVLWKSDTNLEISLGTNFSVQHNDTLSFSTSFLDLNRYNFNSNISYVTLRDTSGPLINSVYLDAVTDSYCKTLYVTFNVPISASSLDTSYFKINNMASFSSLTIINDSAVKLINTNSIKASYDSLTVTNNVLDSNGVALRDLTNKNILDTVAISIVRGYINTNNDTLNLTADIYFSKIYSNSSLSNFSNFKNINVSSIDFLDSTYVRLHLSSQFKASSDSLGINNFYDYGDSNLTSSTQYITLQETVKPYLKSISFINADSNTDYTYGDTLVLYFSESIDTTLIDTANVNTLLPVSGSGSYGDSNSVKLNWEYYNTILKITLGQNPNIAYNRYINPTNSVVDWTGNIDNSSNITIPDSYAPDVSSVIIAKDTNSLFAYSGYDNDNNVNFYWSTPIATDVDSYAIYLSTNSGADTLIGYTTNKYYNYAGVNYHDNYTIKIKAIDHAGNYSSYSASSNTIVFDTIAIAPSQPIHTDAVYNSLYDTDLTVNLQWTFSDSDLLYYEIYIDSGNGNNLYDTTTNTKYSFTGKYRLSYIVKIKTIDLAGNTSAFSIASNSITIDTGDVSNVTNIIHTDDANTIYDNDTQLSFSWTGVSDTDFNYYLLYINYNNGSYTYVDTTTSTNYNFNVNNAGTYTIKIYTKDLAGNLSDSSISSIVVVDTYVNKVNLTSPLFINTNDTSQTFIWSASSDADTYRFQISTDSFATIYYDTYLNSSITQILKLLPNNDYEWRVYSIDNAGNQNISTETNYLSIDTSVTKPSLTFPVNNYDTNNHQPYFNWTITDADTYYFYFGKDTGAGFVASETFVFDNTVNSTYISSLYNNDTYIWYLVVEDNAGNTNVSTLNNLFLSGVQAFDTVSPAYGTETNDSYSEFVWNSTIGAETYTLMYSTDLYFTSNIVTKQAAGTSTVPDTRLPEGNVYWKVIGTDIFGNTNATKVCLIKINTVVDMPDTFFPTSNYITNDTNLTFSWNKSSDAVKYRIRLSKLSTMPDTSVYFDTYTTSLFKEDMIFEQADTYYWKLYAYDSFNNETHTNIIPFEIDLTVDSVTLLEPENNYSTSYVTPDKSLIFKWTRSNDANSYKLQISNDSGFNNLLFDSTLAFPDSVTHPTVYTMEDTLSEGLYYWRIKTQDAAANVNYSQTYNFIIDQAKPIVVLDYDSSIINADSMIYSGTIVENNIDTMYITVNDTKYFMTLTKIDTNIYRFVSNSNLIFDKKINSISIYVRDIVGFVYQNTFTIYKGSDFIQYDTSSIINLNVGDVKLIQFSGNDTKILPIKINNDTVLLSFELDTPAVILSLQLLPDLNVDTSNFTNFNSTKNYIMSVIVYDTNGTPIYDDAALFKHIFINFDLSNYPALRNKYLGVYSVASDSKWYEVTDSENPDGTVISDSTQYIRYDTGIGVYVKHLSIYGVFTVSLNSSVTLDNIVVYPVPFIPYDNKLKTGIPYVAGDYNSGIHFGIDNNYDGTIDNALPANTTISIFSVLGEKISSSVISDNKNMVIWDAKNDEGNECASGLYYAIIKYNNVVVKKKIVIIR